MTSASIAGREVALDVAIAEAARLLAASRSAVIGGLGTDAAGAAAAVALARAVGGSVDHAAAAAGLRNLDVMRRAGWLVTTPLQVRARADTVLLVGAIPPERWAAIAGRLALDRPPTMVEAAPRTVFQLAGTQLAGTQLAGTGTFTAVTPGLSPLAAIAALRALVAGRAVSLPDAERDALASCAAALRAAKFGVAIWSAETLDDLAIEMLCGLVDDLNRTTRFAGLPLGPPDNERGVSLVCTAQLGFPARTGFGSTEPAHDPWRFDAERLVASGEADAAVWLSAITPAPPPWDDAVPTVALVCADTSWDAPPAVAITVGRPGIDHDAVLFDDTLDAQVAVRAQAASQAPSAASVLQRIAAAC